MIPFGEYLPDLPDYENPGATVANNALPHAMSYLPWPDQSVYSNALSARCRGGIVGREDDGDIHIIVGDETNLYRLADATFGEISSTAGAYSTAATDMWEFAQWDQNIYATNFTDEIQVASIGSGDFADTGVTAIPQCRHITVMRDFLVTGNTSDAVDGDVPNRIRWSPKGAPENDWTVNATTQADYQDIKGPGGWVQRLFGGEYGVVFQEYSTWRMTYAGSPVVWQLDEVRPGRGLLAPGAATQVGDMIFYLSQDGFEVLHNGSDREPIGAKKVDQTVLADLDFSNLDRIACAADPREKRVYWAYPGIGNVGGTPNVIMAYDYASQRWASSEQSVQFLLAGASSGYTLEGLDSISTDVDALPLSLDSPFWAAAVAQIAMMNSSNKLAFWGGTAMNATLETPEMQLVPGRRAMVRTVRPVVDGGTTTVQIGARTRQSDPVSFGAAASVNTDGRATQRSNARYHRFRVNISGEFTHAQGVDIEASQAGNR